LQIQRQRRIEFNLPSIRRMCKQQARGVEERSLQALDGAKVSCGPAMHSSVCRITHNRMANRAQMDADLMRAARRDCHMEQRYAIEIARESHSRNRMSRAPSPG
jgi:hypothetical protein